MHTQGGVAFQTPVRISFGNGGDTDYYLQPMGWGCVLNATLSSLYYKCTLLAGQNRVLSYNDLSQNKNTVTGITDSRLLGDHLDLFKATLNHVSPEFKGNIHIETNTPAMSGLGGSSSLMVAFIASLKKINNQELNQEEIASQAYHIERKIMNVKGGYQDQWAASYGGGFNLFKFKIGHVEREHIKLNESTLQKLEKNLCLFSVSPRKISGHEIHKLQEKKVEENKEQIINAMKKKRENTLKMKEALLNNELDHFGKLLNLEWELKKETTPGITDPELEETYALAKENGAIGGKVTGSGGCSFFYCKNKDQVQEALEKEGAKFFPVKFQRPHEPGIQSV